MRYPTFGELTDYALDKIFDAIREGVECDLCTGDHLTDSCGECEDEDVEDFDE